MTGQLIDATSGAHIWADRFESTLDDIFALQDQMAQSVVRAIIPKLEQAEIERVKWKPTEKLNAYDCFLRGMAAWHDWTQSSHNNALKLFYKAIEVDPEFGRPYALGAGCYLMRKANGWIIDRAAEIAETERLAILFHGVSILKWMHDRLSPTRIRRLSFPAPSPTFPHSSLQPAVRRGAVLKAMAPPEAVLVALP
jgi:hypothetical protein